MIQNEIKNEAEIRRFLFGEISDDERSAIEEKFITDEGFFEQIRVVEDELIESYIRGTLAGDEKNKFERNFLITEPRRQRVAFARTMLDQLTESKEIAAVKKTETVAAAPSVWDSVTNFFKMPGLAFGVAFAILLATFGGWFLLKNSNQREIARQVTPTPSTATETIQSNSNQPLESNQNSVVMNSNLQTPDTVKTNANNSGQRNETPNKNSNTQKIETIAVNPILALFAGTVRSEGKTRELNLSKNANYVYLQLNLEGTDYKVYRAEIVTADGEIIFRRDRLIPDKLRINFSVPAGKLQTGDYIVKLSALNPQSENESVADYTFRITRK